jgi:Glutaredoxin-like domain (DUF836)
LVDDSIKGGIVPNSAHVIRLILYSKIGCHLCAGLQEKLEAMQQFQLELEVRDISSRDDWWQTYEYEVPVLYAVHPDDGTLKLIPRPSPRITVAQLEQLLQKHMIVEP